VIAESVNPLPVTRAAWRETAGRAGVPAVEVEVVCSDLAEHRRRAAGRTEAESLAALLRDLPVSEGVHPLDVAGPHGVGGDG
jgi:predicted kinase